jgi:hypothetical protein
MRTLHRLTGSFQTAIFERSALRSEIADLRVHGTTGDGSVVRLQRDDK